MLKTPHRILLIYRFFCFPINTFLSLFSVTATPKHPVFNVCSIFTSTAQPLRNRLRRLCFYYTKVPLYKQDIFFRLIYQFSSPPFVKRVQENKKGGTVSKTVPPFQPPYHIISLRNFSSFSQTSPRSEPAGTGRA